MVTDVAGESDGTPALPATAAPCGPGCRYAEKLRDAAADYVWCRRLGVPRSIGGEADICRWFSAGAADSDADPPAKGW